MNQFTLSIELTPEDNSRLSALCGPQNENLRIIEAWLNITLKNRGHYFSITGAQKDIQKAEKILRQLYLMTENPHAPIREELNLLLNTIGQSIQEQENEIIFHAKRGAIKARGKNQKIYFDNLLKYSINFGIGPAGTGKTYLAVACAVDTLKKDKVRRIVLVRPAVEAGEKLGFLPGDLAQKIDPYLRPLYDALYEMLGFEQVENLLAKNIIEIAPLAYMRGRTLNDAFIILDESQNTTPEQMKMFLTRIGFGSTAVITGDITQIDLAYEKRSELVQIIDILKNIKDISFTFFDSKDVVRHPIVQKIIEAYEKHERKR